MIGHIAGTLTEKNPPRLLVDCHGTGYEIDVLVNTFCNLPATSERVVLFTQQIVHEDTHLLYGFGAAVERGTFHQPIKISGIGARIALAALSGVSVAELAQAVTLQETGRLARIPDIDEKTVGRLLLELKGKLGIDLGMMPSGPAVSDDMIDVLDALLTLGYSGREATPAAKQVSVGTDVSEGIELALKILSKG